MSFNAIRENKILAKISEFTVLIQETETRKLSSKQAYMTKKCHNRKVSWHECVIEASSLFFNLTHAVGT